MGVRCVCVCVGGGGSSNGWLSTNFACHDSEGWLSTERQLSVQFQFQLKVA